MKNDTTGTGATTTVSDAVLADRRMIVERECRQYGCFWRRRAFTEIKPANAVTGPCYCSGCGYPMPVVREVDLDPASELAKALDKMRATRTTEGK